MISLANGTNLQKIRSDSPASVVEGGRRSCLELNWGVPRFLSYATATNYSTTVPMPPNVSYQLAYIRGFLTSITGGTAPKITVSVDMAKVDGSATSFVASGMNWSPPNTGTAFSFNTSLTPYDVFNGSTVREFFWDLTPYTHKDAKTLVTTPGSSFYQHFYNDVVGTTVTPRSYLQIRCALTTGGGTVTAINNLSVQIGLHIFD